MGLKEAFDTYKKGEGAAEEEGPKDGANEEEGAEEVIHHKHGKKHSRYEKTDEHEEGQGGEDCPMCGGTGKE